MLDDLPSTVNSCYTISDSVERPRRKEKMRDTKCLVLRFSLHLFCRVDSCVLSSPLSFYAQFEEALTLRKPRFANTCRGLVGLTTPVFSPDLLAQISERLGCMRQVWPQAQRRAITNTSPTQIWFVIKSRDMRYTGTLRSSVVCASVSQGVQWLNTPGAARFPA